MALSKGEHGTCPTKKVGGVIVNADSDGDADEMSSTEMSSTSSTGKSAKTSHKGETKARLDAGESV